mmetsp:Transcript_44221/g.140720  ORF Transcript_44221/g.140720 Transcript_44221/m.140720 type:complete len:203 (-) Transcript_44221:35-643(-)
MPALEPGVLLPGAGAHREADPRHLRAGQPPHAQARHRLRLPAYPGGGGGPPHVRVAAAAGAQRVERRGAAGRRVLERGGGALLRLLVVRAEGREQPGGAAAGAHLHALRGGRGRLGVPRGARAGRADGGGHHRRLQRRRGHPQSRAHHLGECAREERLRRAGGARDRAQGGAGPCGGGQGRGRRGRGRRGRVERGVGHGGVG